MSVLLVDTSWLMYRSFYSFNLSSKRAGIDIPTGHLYGLIRAVKTLKYDKIVFVKDNYPKRRHELFPGYKDREGGNNQIYQDFALVSSLFQHLDWVTVLEVEDREADEVIGFLAHNTDGEVTVYSGDDDMLQLLALRNVSVGKSVKNGKVVPLEQNYVEDKFGVNPSQLPLS